MAVNLNEAKDFLSQTNQYLHFYIFNLQFFMTNRLC